VLTGADGRASTTLSLLGIPGDYQVKVTFPGTAEYIASKTESDFTITKQSTTLQIEPQSATAIQNQDTGMIATLQDATGRRLVEKTVFFVVEGNNGAASKSVITDYIGRARLGSLDLPPGAYSVSAYFATDPGEVIALKTDGEVTEITFVDERYTASNDQTGSLTLLPANNSPVCTAANAETVPPMYLENLAIAWPPNSRLVTVNVIGVTDPDGDPVTIHIDSIFQDEPTGRRPASPDGFGVGTSTAQVRAERDQNANGRMYYLTFTASDGKGGSCSAKVQVGVPPDQGGQIMPVGDGELYDSTIAR
jgi:hypothetical protein